MAWKTGFLASALVLGGNTGAFSMDSQTLDARILDSRVVKCGVTIESGAMTRIRPFIETSESLAGKFAITVHGRSGTNTNFTSQTVSFPGNNLIAIGQPSSISIEMVATSGGAELCRLSENIDFDAPGTRT
jgi:hypothetical protein